MWVVAALSEYLAAVVYVSDSQETGRDHEDTDRVKQQYEAFVKRFE